MKKFVLTLVCGAFALCLAVDSADARPNFMKVFTEAYPNVTAASTAKCNVCHVNGQEKKVRNDYGKAVGGAIGAKSEKDVEKIKAALKKVEEEHKEYAEALKAGKLPVE
ncbi:MAG: hypothetical protein J0M17_12025 [Planctomycetes bacterium]|nr:hypothetical protein [Planctomycetota bacterium]